jgi:RNA polymerase primary sigma factor
MFEIELQSDRRQDASLQHYLRTIGKYTLLTKEQEYDLARRVREGDKDALDSLVNANLRFVASVAKRYLNQGLTYMDLIAEGNIGLITAAQRFDERRGFRFITYAVWWIRQAIQKAVAEQTNTVRLPVNRVLQVQSLRRLTRSLEQERQGAVQEEDIAAHAGMSVRKLEQLRAAASPLVSLDESTLDDDVSMAETLTDPEEVSPEDSYIQEEMHQELDAALRQLSDRERRVVTYYYGLGQRQAWSLEAIGETLGLSRERVRQIRNQALTKMRRAERGQTLQEYLR